MSCPVDGVLTVSGCGFDLLKGAVQPFLMGRSEGLKLNSDPVPA
jgi:hypothetical protein